MRVVVADDHPLVRSGVRALLADAGWIEVVGEAATGLEALALVERLAPDCVVMDVAMRDLDGLEACARIARDHPATRVVILSMHSESAYVQRALEAGAAAYVSKDAPPRELEAALRRVAGLAPRPDAAPTDDPLERLSPRQRDVLRRLAEGQTMKEIALRLGVSVKTIEAHRAELVRRLGIPDLPGLVRLAVRAGLVDAAR